MRSAESLDREAGGIVYPDSDGQPMSDNTTQYRWIQLLETNLKAAVTEAFVAGNLLWYPVEGNNKLRVGPDVLVAIGRPRVDRGSYRTWEEGGQPPDVVIEVLSPSNSMPEMVRKMAFYDRYGVKEFWVVDPDVSAYAYVRGEDGMLTLFGTDEGFTSPLLGVRFVRGEQGLAVFHADGAPFLSVEEIRAKAEAAEARAQAEAKRAEAEAKRAEAEAQRAEAEAQRAEKLAAKLRELGIDPESL